MTHATNHLQFLRSAFLFIILFCNGCSGDGGGSFPQTAKSSLNDINGDGYSDLVVGSFGGYGESQDHIYVFYGNSSGVDTIAANKLRYDKHNAFIMGDVNSDEYADLIVAINTYNDIGRVYVNLGSRNGIGSPSDQYYDGESGHTNFGDSLSLNDINGDGHLDLIIGASNYNNGSGRVYLYLGTGEGLGNDIWKIIEYDSDGDRYGETLSTGDINGDGYCDLAVGAPGIGKIFIYNGMPGNIEDSPSRIIDASILQNPVLSNMRLLLSDINLDGYSDLVICNREKAIFPCPPEAPIGDCGDIIEFRVEFYYGGPSGLEDTADTILVYNDLSGAIAVGDINADGFMDIAIGGINKVQIHMGSASGISNTTSNTLNGNNQFGGAISFADLNGDGFYDLSVGAAGVNSGQYIGERGEVYIYDGGSVGLGGTPSQILEGENIGDRFGFVLPIRSEFRAVHR